MITKAEINLIRSLGDKRNRAKHGVFVVEGIKSISEMSQAGLEMEALYTTTDGAGKNIKQSEMERISALKSPTEHLALFRIPKQHLPCVFLLYQYYSERLNHIQKNLQGHVVQD